MTPSADLVSENDRLRSDCKRLMAIVEASADYEKWARHRSALRGTHYIGAAECLAHENVVSALYAPEHDRDVRLCLLVLRAASLLLPSRTCVRP